MSLGDAALPRRVGRYELCARIASGGMASVYFGRIIGSEGFSRVVAIKRMHPHLAEVAEFRAMFIDEARLAARIHHPNVAQILDLLTESEELLLVMGYIHGTSVAGLLQGEPAPPLPVSVALRIAIDALYGLHAAHSARDEAGVPLGIVHRDVSPQNLLVSTEGVTIVVDFGVAKAATRLQTSRAGELKGKIRYMPPEQIRHEPVGPEADVYALAVVLWEMLTGARLFTGTNEAALVAQVLDGAKARPGSLRPELPRALEDVVMRGLERDLSKRYPSALAMAEALEELKLTGGAREVTEVVAQRAEVTLRAREAALRNIHDASAAGGEPADGAILDRTLTGRRGVMGAGAPQPEDHLSFEESSKVGARTRSRTLFAGIAALASVVLLAGVALWPSKNAAVPLASSPEPTPIVDAASSAPSSIPSLADASAVPPAIASATATTSPPPPRPWVRPPRPPPAPAVDCTKNPKVLGPDGLYHVRKECLGR